MATVLMRRCIVDAGKRVACFAFQMVQGHVPGSFVMRAQEVQKAAIEYNPWMGFGARVVGEPITQWGVKCLSQSVSQKLSQWSLTICSMGGSQTVGSP